MIVRVDVGADVHFTVEPADVAAELTIRCSDIATLTDGDIVEAIEERVSRMTKHAAWPGTFSATWAKVREPGEIIAAVRAAIELRR